MLEHSTVAEKALGLYRHWWEAGAWGMQMGASQKLKGLSTLIFKTPIWKWEVPGPPTRFP